MCNWVCRRVFFFFQAEDGIRDDLVTGVQTCALPISRREARGSGKIVKGLSATCADEFRLPAPVGRALLARAAAREAEESGRSAQRISGRVEVERQVQAGPGSAEAARKRLSEVFRNVNAHTRSSAGGRGRLPRQ